MHVRIRLVKSMIALAITLFVIGSIAALIVAPKVTTSINEFSDTYSIEPTEEKARNITTSTPTSTLDVALNATEKIEMRISLNDNIEYFKNESELQHVFLLEEPGQWKIVLKNSNNEPVNYTHALILKTYLTKTVNPYAWILFPSYVIGEIALCLIIPITFYDDVKRKWNRKKRCLSA